MNVDIREHIARLRDGDVEKTDAVPAGRFFKGADAVWRQRYRLPPDFALFQGHFPGNPVLPALGHVMLARSAAEIMSGRTLVAAGIGQAKFLALVEPGAVLDVLMTPSRDRDGVWLFQNVCLQGGEPIEAARIKMTLKQP